MNLRLEVDLLDSCLTVDNRVFVLQSSEGKKSVILVDGRFRRLCHIFPEILYAFPIR